MQLIEVTRCLRYQQVGINLIVLIILSLLSIQASARVLRLNDALTLTVENNPTLKSYPYRLKMLEGDAYDADMAPAVEMNFEVENILGSGPYSGANGGDYTLSVSSVFELGEKRLARNQVVAQRYSLLETRQSVETMQVFGEIVRSFVASLAQQERMKLGQRYLVLLKQTLDSVEKRAQKGATPEAEVLRAKAQLQLAEISLDKLKLSYKAGLVKLANAIGDSSLEITQLDGSLYRFNQADDFDVIFERFENSPISESYRLQERVRDAEVNLAKSHSRSNIQWQAGARYFEEVDDSAFVASISMPLFSERRNRGKVKRAVEQRNAFLYQRDSELLALKSELFKVYSEYQQSLDELSTISADIIPQLTKAQQQTRTAYEQGLYSYVELQASQYELNLVLQQRVDAAEKALLSQSWIEEITGQATAQITQ